VQPDAAGDLVDNAVVDRVAGVVDGDGTGRLLDTAGHDLVDVHQHGVDETKIRGASDVGDVARGAALGDA
jgi:hypothetical protein